MSEHRYHWPVFRCTSMAAFGCTPRPLALPSFLRSLASTLSAMPAGTNFTTF